MFQLDFIDQYFVQEPDNEMQLDDIFGWKKITSREICSDSCLNTGYQYPARMRYYFSNISDEELRESINIVHDNNIPISVVHKMNATQDRQMAKVLGPAAVREDNSGWCKEGVYIVDYYNLDHAIGDGHKHSIKYILESDKIYKTNVVLNALIRNYVSRKSEEKVQLSRYFKYPDIKIRIVSFIPKETIIENLITKVRELDIVVHVGEISPSFDYNEEKKKSIQPIDLTPKHYTRYDVINNEDNEFPSFVYTVIGNTVTKIPVVKNTARKSGCYVSKHTNGICVSNEYSTLDKMEETFGIYKNYLDAKYFGDPNKQIENRKLDLEEEKIAVGYKELDYKKYEIRNKRFMSLLELDKKRDEHIFNMEKIKLQVEIDNAKHLAELKILMAKYTQEAKKAGKLDLTTYFTIALNCLKMIK